MPELEIKIPARAKNNKLLLSTNTLPLLNLKVLNDDKRIALDFRLYTRRPVILSDHNL